MQDESPDFFKIIETLSRHNVSYIVVGGVCAVLLGAPVTTFDLDIVPSLEQKNRDRLLSAIKELEGYYREHLPKKLEPTLESLNSSGHHLLTTKYGPLDVLGSIGSGSDYLTLQHHIEMIHLDNGVELRILDLKTLIDEKEKTKRDKDVGMLKILKVMLEEDINS
ncbi:MAG: hypothetical protein HKN85_11635 [Gammaproteobacteria bacterium]|nr:hypothetical protein [Gammaproteobacteria bacterium]